MSPVPTESFSPPYLHRRLLLDSEKRVVGVEIKTPGRVVLAASADGAPPGALVVNPDADLTVYADEIVIFRHNHAPRPQRNAVRTPRHR